MEHRHDLEQTLFNGLTENEQRLTRESMSKATTSKLAWLRSRDSGAGFEDEPVEDDDLDT